MIKKKELLIYIAQDDYNNYILNEYYLKNNLDVYIAIGTKNIDGKNLYMEIDNMDILLGHMVDSKNTENHSLALPMKIMNHNTNTIAKDYQNSYINQKITISYKSKDTYSFILDLLLDTSMIIAIVNDNKLILINTIDAGINMSLYGVPYDMELINKMVYYSKYTSNKLTFEFDNSKDISLYDIVYRTVSIMYSFISKYNQVMIYGRSNVIINFIKYIDNLLRGNSMNSKDIKIHNLDEFTLIADILLSILLKIIYCNINDYYSDEIIPIVYISNKIVIVTINKVLKNFSNEDVTSNILIGKKCVYLSAIEGELSSYDRMEDSLKDIDNNYFAIIKNCIAVENSNEVTLFLDINPKYDKYLKQFGINIIAFNSILYYIDSLDACVLNSLKIEPKIFNKMKDSNDKFFTEYSIAMINTFINTTKDIIGLELDSEYIDIHKNGILDIIIENVYKNFLISNEDKNLDTLFPDRFEEFSTVIKNYYSNNIAPKEIPYTYIIDILIDIYFSIVYDDRVGISKAVPEFDDCNFHYAIQYNKYLNSAKYRPYMIKYM